MWRVVSDSQVRYNRNVWTGLAVELSGVRWRAIVLSMVWMRMRHGSMEERVKPVRVVVQSSRDARAAVLVE
jgi:hypothetical protein